MCVCTCACACACVCMRAVGREGVRVGGRENEEISTIPPFPAPLSTCSAVVPPEPNIHIYNVQSTQIGGHSYL